MTDEIVVVSHQMAKEMVIEIESKLSVHFTKIPMEPEPVSMDEMMKESTGSLQSPKHSSLGP